MQKTVSCLHLPDELLTNCCDVCWNLWYVKFTNNVLLTITPAYQTKLSKMNLKERSENIKHFLKGTNFEIVCDDSVSAQLYDSIVKAKDYLTWFPLSETCTLIVRKYGDVVRG